MDSLRLLVLEDSQEDLELIVRDLVADDFDVQVTRAEDADGLVVAMNAQRFDAVVVDYVMPRLTWPRAIALVRELDEFVPVVVVSGKKGEEFAVETIRGGCDDYVLKDRLFRLAPALRRGMRQAAERRAAREERARLEEQLRQARKLEAVGLFAASVTHDLNNSLTVAGGAIEFALSDATLSEQARDSLRDALVSAERVGAAMRQLRAVESAPVRRPSAVDLNRLVRQITELVRLRLPRGIQLRVAQEAEFPRLSADAVALERALLNLILNARDAIEGEGLITLRVRRELRPCMPGEAAQPCAVVDVIDDGAGLSGEARERAFEPFFTTKGERGSGLGLTSAYQCARAHGGGVELAAASPRGTRATLYLPAVQIAASRALEGAMPGRGERILIVDGQEDAALMDAATLEAAGFAPRTAGSVDDALARLDAAGDIDLVIADVLIPGGGAQELLRRRPQRHADVPVILASAFRESHLEAGFAGLIRKPIEPGAFAQAISALLQNRAGR